MRKIIRLKKKITSTIWKILKGPPYVKSGILRKRKKQDKTPEVPIVGEPLEKYCQPSHPPFNLQLHPPTGAAGSGEIEDLGVTLEF